MAVVSVTDSNLRRQDMEGAVSGTTNIGAGAGPGTFAEAIYQGAQEWGRKIGAASSLRGFFVTITSIDMTAAGDEVLIHKSNIVNSAAIDPIGDRARIGSATTAYHEYLLQDDGTRGDIDYPIVGGWVINPIDPNIAAWRDFITGSPSLTAVTEIGFAGAITITTVNENMIGSAIDFGPGLFLVGGDSTDPDGTIQDFIDDDEGTLTAGRFGHVSTRGEAIFVFGTLVIGRTATGTVTATEYTDSNRSLFFPGGRVDAGWNGIEIDLGNASTVVSWNAYAITGEGRSNIKRWFDSSADQVDGTNNEVDITGHGFSTGDTVLYTDEGGAAFMGLNDSNEYFVRAVTDDSLAFYTMAGGRDNAYTDTSRVSLTASATGEQHSLRRTPLTLPNITVTGTAGSFVPTACNFVNVGDITLTSAAPVTGGSIVGFASVTLNQGTISGVSVSGATTSEREAGFITADPSDISDVPFTASVNGGHAVEGTATGSFPYSGNTHTGYGPAQRSFDTETDVDSGTDVVTTDAAHGYTTGDPAILNDDGGTETFGLTDQARYYVRAVTTTTLGFYVTRADAVADTNRIALTPSGAGLGETQFIESANAAYKNSSGGLQTLSITGGGDTPSFTNTAGSSTVVINSVDLKITVTNQAGNLMQGINCRYQESDTTLIAEGSTNASGVFLFAIAVADLPLTAAEIIVRRKDFEDSETILDIPITGFDIPIKLDPDRDVNLP